MKHDKLKKQRANVVVPLTAVGRQQMRQAGRSGSEVAGQRGWGGITPLLLPLVKVDFHARCSYNSFLKVKRKRKKAAPSLCSDLWGGLKLPSSARAPVIPPRTSQSLKGTEPCCPLLLKCPPLLP